MLSRVLSGAEVPLAGRSCLFPIFRQVQRVCSYTPGRSARNLVALLNCFVETPLGLRCKVQGVAIALLCSGSALPSIRRGYSIPRGFI